MQDWLYLLRSARRSQSLEPPLVAWDDKIIDFALNACGSRSVAEFPIQLNCERLAVS